MVQVHEPLPHEYGACAAWVAELPLLRRYGLTPAAAERALRGAPRLLVAGSGEGVVAFDPAGGFGRTGYIRLLAVARPGAGVGTALLRAAESEVFASAPGMLLLCADFNEAARAFYARRGYREVGAIPGFVLPDVTEVVFWKPRAAAAAGGGSAPPPSRSG
jgi:GNAT superfamily N-acetyltransferase